MAKKKAPAITPLTPRVLNGEATAAYLGVSVTKFYEMRKMGLFKVQPLPYGVFFDVHQVNSWLDELGGIENVEQAFENAWLEAAHG